MVLEMPPADQKNSITGSVDDGWQAALQDVGPAGVDKGQGGKYLILPPGDQEKVPDGYIPLPSSAYTGFAILRSNLKSSSEADVAKSVAYGKSIKFYPLSQASSSPATKFVDAIDVLFDSTIPYDLRFYEALDRFVQREPSIDRDRAMIDMLKTIGIEKGKPFKPGRENKAGPERRRARGACLIGPPVRTRVQGAVQRGHALGSAGVASSDQRDDDELRRC